MKPRTLLILLTGLTLVGLVFVVPLRSTPPAPAGPLASREVRPPRLPAPRLVTTPTPLDASDRPARSTNLLVRLLHHGETLTLNPEQAEAYLRANRRSAESLLAAFRVTGDQALLREALEQHPQDARLNFAAYYALKDDSSPEQRRRHLEAFKRSAPDNALASYLSAQNYFQAGQTDEAVRELVTAAGQTRWQDYTGEFLQNLEEVYRSAGYAEGEARTAAAFATPLPHLADLRRLGQNLGELASLYHQGGDEASALAARQMGVTLGHQVGEATGSHSLIHDVVGLSIERQILEQMDPAALYDTSGRTVQHRLEELTGLREEFRQLQGMVDPDGRWSSLAGLQALSEPDLISFFDRVKVTGELEALRWLRTRLGGP